MIKIPFRLPKLGCVPFHDLFSRRVAGMYSLVTDALMRAGRATTEQEISRSLQFYFSGVCHAVELTESPQAYASSVTSGPAS